MDVLTAIKERRSCRQYKPDPINEEDLTTLLEAARWAPSWANTQCCRLVVVRNEETRLQLAGCLAPNNPATAAMSEAPVLIVACAERQKAGYKRGEAVTDKGDYWYMYDTGLAMQNLTLAAWSLGLGTVHIGLFDAAKAAAVLGLPPAMVCVAMTPVGYPDGEFRNPGRRELGEIVFHEKYGQGA